MNAKSRHGRLNLTKENREVRKRERKTLKIHEEPEDGRRETAACKQESSRGVTTRRPKGPDVAPRTRSLYLLLLLHSSS